MSKAKRVFFFKLFLVLLAVALFISPDAAGAPEIEQRVLVSVLGLDKEGDTFTVTAQVVIPKRAEEGEPNQSIVKAEGKSVPEGIDRLNRALGRSVELGHCGALVLGSLPDTKPLEYFLAGGIVTAGTNLVSVENAFDFIQSVQDMSSSSATGLDGYIAFSTSSAASATHSLLQFVSETASVSRTSYMPVLEAGEQEENPSGGGAGQDGEQSGGEQSGGQESGGSGEQSGGQSSGQSGEQQSGGQSSEQSGGKSGEQSGGGANGQSGGSGGQSGGQSGGGSGGGQKAASIKSAEKTDIFVDGVKAGTFEETETRGLAWIDRTSNRGFVQLENFEREGKSYGGIYAQLKRKSASIEPYFKEGKPFVRIKVRAKLELSDKHKLNELALEYGETAAVDMLQEAYESLLRSEIGAAIVKADSFGADPFGFRSAFYRKENKGYTAYGSDLTADLKTEYAVSVKIV